MMSNKTILAIGAHHDDIELRVGGTLAKYLAAGWRVEYILLATTPHVNARSRVREQGVLTTREATDLRKSEARAAAKILGIDNVHFWDFRSIYWYRPGTYERIYMDGIVAGSQDLEQHFASAQGREYLVSAHRIPHVVQSVADSIAGFNADIVLTHTANDMHWEHFATSALVCEAVKTLNAGGNPVRLFGWEPGGMHGLHNPFLPTCFEDITETIDRKCEAVMVYHSQFRNLQLVADTLRQRARYYGARFGVAYAEPYLEFTPILSRYDTDAWLPDWYDGRTQATEGLSRRDQAPVGKPG